ncbi:transposase domain-containing protein [Streptomyces sp. NPDC002688]|uniref:transposase domain-containing protein n=1 Tax=Streptomyces sp. NPDC002688 TaxID=3154423 RepID=UPI003325B89F
MAACGCAEQRKRLLPARLVVYFVLGLALFSPAPYLGNRRNRHLSRPHHETPTSRSVKQRHCP